MTRQLVTTINDSLINCKSEEVKARAEEYILYKAWNINKASVLNDLDKYKDKELTEEEEEAKEALNDELQKYDSFIKLHENSCKDFKANLTRVDKVLLTLCAYANTTVYDSDTKGIKNFGKATIKGKDSLDGFTLLCNSFKVVNELKDVDSPKKADKDALNSAYTTAERSLLSFVCLNYNVDNDSTTNNSYVFNNQKISVHVGKHGPVNKLLKRFSTTYGLNGKNESTYKFSKSSFFTSIASWLYKNLTDSNGNDFTGLCDYTTLAEKTNKEAEEASKVCDENKGILTKFEEVKEAEEAEEVKDKSEEA